MATVGQTAPDFTLKNADEQAVSLSDLKGKWTVLYFYPKDNTSGCTREAIGFTEVLDDFTALNTRVIGVSPDSIKSHCNFRDKHELRIELLSDPDKELIQAIGAWGEKKNYGKTYMGLIRSTFIIDPDGVIRESWSNVKVPGHVDKVKAKLEALQKG